MRTKCIYYLQLLDESLFDCLTRNAGFRLGPVFHGNLFPEILSQFWGGLVRRLCSPKIPSPLYGKLVTNYL